MDNNNHHDTNDAIDMSREGVSRDHQHHEHHEHHGHHDHQDHHEHHGHHTSHHHSSTSKHGARSKKRDNSSRKYKKHIPEHIREPLIIIATLVLVGLFLAFAPSDVAISKNSIMSKWLAATMTLSFASMGAVLYLLSGRLFSSKAKEALVRGYKSCCRILSCAGIVVLIVVVCSTAVLRPFSTATNLSYEQQIAKLEQKISALEAQLGIKDPNGEQSSSNNTKNEIPDYWREELDSAISDITNTQDAIGDELISFVWTSDTHIPDSQTMHLGSLMAEVLDKCDISFATISGDIVSQASFATEAALWQNYKSFPNHLAPLWGTKRLLAAVGNHDGAYGDSNGYYRKQLPLKKMLETFFDDQQKDSRRVFSENGTYFYVDDTLQQVRYILLNSQFGGEQDQYRADADGYAVWNRFATSCYGQKQLDWLADTALDMPEGYAAVIVTHVPPNAMNRYDEYTVDQEQLNGIITAYCNKTTFSGVIDTEAGKDWYNSNIDVDFSDAKGEIIGVFSGHCHLSTVDLETLPCPIITVANGGGDVREAPERVVGTSTETAFDVVMINRHTRTIYCTRVGAGDDRVIKY